MPAPAFQALFEVSAETFGLCAACIAGAGFICRAATSKQNGLVQFSGLAASLITAFFCIYGLTYWFSGIGGYSCMSLFTIMNSCVSVSQGLALLHLFMKANAVNCKNNRWLRHRWMGLLLTATHWGAMAFCLIRNEGRAVQGELEGLDGPRCVSGLDDIGLRAKWATAWCSQLFQTIAFIHPLRCHLIGTARVRLGSGKRRSKWTALFQTPLWRGVIAVMCSLVVTTVLAGFSLARASGKFLDFPVFAAEVLANGATIAATFFALQVDYPKIAPKYPPRNDAQLVIPTMYRRRYGYGGSSGGFYRGGGPGRPGSGYPRRPWRGDSRFLVMSTPKRNRPVDPMVKRLPPVIDASPEVSAANSPELSVEATRGLEGMNAIGGREMTAGNELVHSQGAVGTTLFFASHPRKAKWLPGGVHPQLPLPRPQSGGTRQHLRTYPSPGSVRLSKSSDAMTVHDSNMTTSIEVSITPAVKRNMEQPNAVTAIAEATGNHHDESRPASPARVDKLCPAAIPSMGIPLQKTYPIHPRGRPMSLPSLRSATNDSESVPDITTGTTATVNTDPSASVTSCSSHGGDPAHIRVPGTSLLEEDAHVHLPPSPAGVRPATTLSPVGAGSSPPKSRTDVKRQVRVTPVMALSPPATVDGRDWSRGEKISIREKNRGMFGWWTGGDQDGNGLEGGVEETKDPMRMLRHAPFSSSDSGSDNCFKSKSAGVDTTDLMGWWSSAAVRRKGDGGVAGEQVEERRDDRPSTTEEDDLEHGAKQEEAPAPAKIIAGVN